MTTIHLTATTPVAPERIVSAFTDFTPQRLRTFPNIDPRYYEVHAVGATSAEVTEGSTFFGGVWERAHYDWSHPGEITITVRSSNAFTFGSFWHYSIAAGEHGGSHVDFTLHRVGKNLKGRVLATMIRVFGQRIFRQDLAQTLKRLAEESPATALSCASRPEVCPCKAYVSEEFAKEEAQKLFQPVEKVTFILSSMRKGGQQFLT